MSNDQPAADRTLFRAHHVLDGTERVIDDAAVLIVGGHIQAVGTATNVGQPTDAEVIDLGTNTIMPGLIDTHTHLSFCGDQRLIEQLTHHDTEGMLAEGRLTAGDLLDAGVTTVRDLGALGDVVFRLAQEVADGRTTGPEIIPSTAQLTTRDGPNAALGGGCADLNACLDRIDHDAAAGARVVKIIATGSLSDTATDPTRCIFDDRTVTGIVQHSHRQGMRVAAHAHGAAGVAQAARCGVDTIEHASFLTQLQRIDRHQPGSSQPLTASWPDHVALTALRDHRPWVVPTLSAALAHAHFGPRTSAATVRGFANRLAIVDMLLEHDIPLAAGTDGGTIGNPHLSLFVELEQLRIIGMSTAQAIASATSSAAACLGLDDRGILAPGKRADLIAVAGNPEQHLHTMRAPTLVVQNGIIVHRTTDQSLRSAVSRS